MRKRWASFSSFQKSNADKFRMQQTLRVLLLFLFGALVFVFATQILTGQTLQAILSILATIPLLVGFGLSRRGYLTLPSLILSINMLALTTALLYAGDGLQDIAILLYPTVLVIAGLLLEKRLFGIMMILCLISINWIAIAQIQGRVNNLGKTPQALAYDMVIGTLILCIAGVGIRLIAENLRRSLQMAYQRERDYTQLYENTLREVQERQHVQAELAQSEEKYRSFIEQSSDCLLLVNEQGVIIDANRSYETLTLLSRSELIGRFAWDASIELMPASHRNQATLQKLREFTLKALQNEPTPTPYTAQILRKDGSRRYIQQTTFPIKTEKGHLLGAVLRDITERKEAEAVQSAIYRISEAAQSAANLPDLYRSIHAIIGELMPAKNFFIALYDPNQDLFSVPYLSDEFDTYWEPYPPKKGTGAYVMRTGQPNLITPEILADLESRGEVEILNRRMFYWVGAPLKVSRGVIGIMAVQTYVETEVLTEADRDMLGFVSSQVAATIERKRTELERERLIKELEDKNAELERFTYTVSHDLKAPLITIRGFLGFVERDAQSGNVERLKVDIQRITEATDKMQRLLNELLELSRIGRIVNPPEIVPFEEIVREALELVKGRLARSRVKPQIAANLPSVFVDRSRMVEVLQNLLDNAAKFLGDAPHPSIEIGLQRIEPNHQGVFFVRDNGIGIEAQFHERIFGLFNKLDTQSEGTGVGLALVKRIVEVHGGKVWVESQGIGHGTTFYFSLPLNENLSPEC